ncbi:hypothetical protein GUITHDRAFT_109531 [Guillardia theta CCMP2712]|uniref:Phosphoglycerate mutase n=2 Tax=Guillardia theta TaxID=55529 RepID=L1J8M1_GUITC|nr:hypothetical protein GUITHDRAFT_109531 [Guillardia theta CCMP2712]EKX44410.1 hypothetical protein GUITHDRAFT_109531 [Guillardia theta CCMP2712]|eukprot:XP_005831390.1 hypothetical protein GUITHDRAFT_109531 [Guillardia theta CCMP2712]
MNNLRCSMQSAAPTKKLDLPELKTGSVRVVLIRHGAVDLTTPGMTFPKDCFYGGHDVPLSDYGKLEAQAAANMVEEIPIEQVYCSPLKRALYGGERVAEKFGLTPKQDDRFREVNRGRWLGLTKEQVREKFPGDLEKFQEDPLWCEHGGETYRQLSERVWSGLNDMVKDAEVNGWKNIALVSHMWVTKSIITKVMGIQPDDQSKWAEMNIPTASVSLLDFNLKQRDNVEVLAVGLKPPMDTVMEEGKDGKTWGG